MRHEDVVATHDPCERRRHRFLPDAEMHRTTHFVSGMIFRHEELLSPSNEDHHSIETKARLQRIIAHFSLSAWRIVNSSAAFTGQSPDSASATPARAGKPNRWQRYAIHLRPGSRTV